MCCTLQWTGMIRQLLDKEVFLAAAAFAVSHERQVVTSSVYEFHFTV